MTRSRKKQSAEASPPTAPPTSVAAALVPLWSAPAVRDGRLLLSRDPARGLLLIGPDDGAPPLRLGKPAREFLRQNGFVEETASGAWTRPMDCDADFQDRLDAERVLLKVAEMHRDEGPAGRRGR